MAGRWNDDRDWRADSDWRDERDDRYDTERDSRARWPQQEDRSFGSDRVFGERDTGAAYNRGRRPDWQSRDYEGVSPAMGRGDYESGYRGRDDWRDEQPGPYGYASEGRRFGAAGSDPRWGRQPTPSYGEGRERYEGGRGQGDRDAGSRDFEDRARDTGEFFRRAGRRISNWFSDAGEGTHEDRHRYDAYRGHRGLGPKGYKRSDERIDDEVHQRLTDDSWLDASEVSCSVSAGEVTLSGTVVSREAKHRAERLVEDISGVTHVQNNLRVTSGSYFTRSGHGFGHAASEAGMASPEAVRDVTDGHGGPPAQKKN